jgi:Domain of unknown function (DU1801)
LEGFVDKSAEEQLKTFIDKFEPKNQAFIGAVRRALKKRLPTANELVYDNYNFFVIAYCSTERASDAILSLAADANGIGLHFYHGARLPDPHKVLLGSGAQNRFVRLESVETLSRPEIEALIAAAVTQTKTLLAASGNGKLIIRSISPKQRPRRKSAK